jgi:hypothetical protein
MTNYEIAKKVFDDTDVMDDLMSRGIISINTYICINRYERFRMYRKVFHQMEALEKTASDMKCDQRTIRRAVEWCEMK